MLPWEQRYCPHNHQLFPFTLCPNFGSAGVPFLASSGRGGGCEGSTTGSKTHCLAGWSPHMSCLTTSPPDSMVGLPGRESSSLLSTSDSSRAGKGSCECSICFLTPRDSTTCCQTVRSCCSSKDLCHSRHSGSDRHTLPMGGGL